jgi:Helix-turn-helix
VVIAAFEREYVDANRSPDCRARAQDTDRHVGTRMRERRIMVGLTQHQMAELIGVTYQQAHKYEKGSIASPRGACTTSPRRSVSRSATSSRDWAGTTRSRRRRSSSCCWSWGATSSVFRTASTKKPSAHLRAPWPSTTPGTEPRALVAPVQPRHATMVARSRQGDGREATWLTSTGDCVDWGAAGPGSRVELTAVQSDDSVATTRALEQHGHADDYLGLDRPASCRFAVWSWRLRSSATKLAKPSAPIRTPNAVVGQVVLPLGELGHPVLGCLFPGPGSGGISGMISGGISISGSSS